MSIVRISSSLGSLRVIANDGYTPSKIIMCQTKPPLPNHHHATTTATPQNNHIIHHSFLSFALSPFLVETDESPLI